MSQLSKTTQGQREARAAEVAVILERQRLEMLAALALDVRAAGLPVLQDH